MAKYHEYINKANCFIGKKIYNLRLGQKLSRNNLASSIGVTHQQLHKYEKGINRISIGRLLLIAKALNKPISFFYDGVDNIE